MVGRRLFSFGAWLAGRCELPVSLVVLGMFYHTFFLGDCFFVIVNTPLKMNMEPKNHPIEKENHLPKNLHFWCSKC